MASALRQSAAGCLQGLHTVTASYCPTQSFEHTLRMRQHSMAHAQKHECGRAVLYGDSVAQGLQAWALCFSICSAWLHKRLWKCGVGCMCVIVCGCQSVSGMLMPNCQRHAYVMTCATCHKL